MENFIEQINKILNKISLNIVLIDDDLADKEALTNILVCYEEFKKSLKDKDYKNEGVLEIASKFIDLYLYKGFILEDIEDIPLGLKTANEGITLLKDIFESKSDSKEFDLKISEIIKNLNILLKIEVVEESEEKEKGAEENQASQELTIDNDEDIAIFTGFITESTDHLDSMQFFHISQVMNNLN